MGETRVSVIVPTYNRAHLIDRALHSILNQTYRNFEVIVVDDGSIDNTSEVVRKYKDKRIRYIRHKKNKGAAAARNTGIKAAKGEYIAFLDSDDEWLPEKLEKQLEVFKKGDNKLGVVYTAFSIIEGEKVTLRTPEYRGNIFDFLLARNCVGTASTVLAKKECFDEAGGFDENLPSCQDWDIWIRIARYYEYDYVPEVLVNYYFLKKGSISSNIKSVIDGHKIISRKYKNIIETRNKKIRSAHYFYIGKILWLAGDIKSSVNFFLKSALLKPMVIVDISSFIILNIRSSIEKVLKSIK